MADGAKRLAGYKAVDDYVRSGMVVGLGTGSTAHYVVERIGQKIQRGELEDIVCVPTSEATRQFAESLKIPLVTLDEKSELDVCIDGADEIDLDLNLVKGRGAALLREKMVAQCSKTFVVVADESKFQKDGLGAGGAVPVEVTKFSYQHILNQLKQVGECDAVLRRCKNDPSEPLETDNQNYIVDLYFKSPMKNPKETAEKIAKIVGVVEHGLFLEMASVCLIGNNSDESVHILYPRSS